MDLLKKLRDNPAEVFSLSKSQSTIDQLNDVTKFLLDPIAKDHSALDEIYTEGLDSSQVWGQAQMILQGVGENLLYNEIPKLKERFVATVDEEERKNYSSEDEMYAQTLVEEQTQNDDTSAKKDSGDSSSDRDSESNEEEEEREQNTKEENITASFDNESENTNVPSEDEASSPVKDVFGLNDGFFDIDQFNKQILALENDQNDDDDDDQIDHYASLSENDDSEEQEMDYYDDFFDKPGQKLKNEKVQGASNTNSSDGQPSGELEDDEYEQAVGSAMLDLFADDESREDKTPSQTGNLSSFEKQQQSIQAEIAALEAELIAEKKWAMKGEIKSSDRPVDSLLNDDEVASLDFDRTSKPVPVITNEVTETIEDLIKRRIKNDEFDDLPKRLITDVGKFSQKQKFELSDQKSGKSLAELYEDEYHGVKPEDKLSEEVQVAHDEISGLFTKLNYKLDALCSAHYIPKPNEFKSVEIKVTDAPASISMEDAQPLHISENTKLAPQEVYKVGDDKSATRGVRGTSQVHLKSGLSYSKDELDRDEKQRLRRAKKRAKSKHFSELKEATESRAKQTNSQENGSKRQKTGDVVDTLSRAKNVTVIDQKGQLRDTRGNLKKTANTQGTSGYRL